VPAATKSKSWGDGPQILPLNVRRLVLRDRITYPSGQTPLRSRFRQRRRMKKTAWTQSSIGRKGDIKHEGDVPEASYDGADPGDSTRLVRRASKFWRAAKGRAFLDLPPEYYQGSARFGE